MGRTILLADDSRTIQRAVDIVFEKEAYTVVTVANGDDAIAKAKEIAPSIVLADHKMPGKDGYEVCAALKADPTTSAIPVLIMAGGTTPFDEGKAQGAGCAGHVKKPFDSKGLVEQINELLGGPPAEAAAPAAAAPTAAPAAAMGVPTAPSAPSAPSVPTAPADPFGATRPATPNIKPATPAVDPFAAPTAPAAASPFAAPAAPTAAPVAPAAPSAPLSGSALGDLGVESAPAQPAAPAAPAAPAPAAPAVAAAAQAPVVEQATQAVAAAGTGDSPEAISAAARDIIEKVVWEVVPELAETLIREEIQRLMQDR